MSSPTSVSRPTPTAEFMAHLGGLPIAGVLGTWEHCVAERDRLFEELLQTFDGDSEAPTQLERELFVAWEAAARLCWLYKQFALQVERVVGVVR